jgi:hypothetical protein
MPLSPYTKVAQVVVDGLLYGQQTNNVLHFATNIEPMPDPQTLLGSLEAHIRALWRPATGSDWTLTRLTFRALYPALLDEVERIPNPAIAATGLPALPGTNAAILALRTGLGGRTHRGRIFAPAIIGNDVTNGKFNDTGLAKWQAVGDDLVVRYKSGGSQGEWEMVVLSRKNAAAPGGTLASASVAINVVVARRIPGVIRRRKIGVGS